MCSRNTSQTTNNSSGAGTQELNGSSKGCMSTEHQSSWYYINVQTGGDLTLTIAPQNVTDDYDFAIWGPFTSATANASALLLTLLFVAVGLLSMATLDYLIFYHIAQQMIQKALQVMAGLML
ncbi:MAG: hypothetical protein R2779_04725 [Crocinitomicaceae bacterium]